MQREDQKGGSGAMHAKSYGMFRGLQNGLEVTLSFSLHLNEYQF